LALQCRFPHDSESYQYLCSLTEQEMEEFASMTSCKVLSRDVTCITCAMITCWSRVMLFKPETFTVALFMVLSIVRQCERLKSCLKKRVT
jgi:hypothetical protein